MAGYWVRRDCPACGTGYEFKVFTVRQHVSKRGVFFPLELFLADLLGSTLSTPPCPECGHLPPDAEGKTKRRGHVAVGFGLLAVFGVAGVAGGVGGISFTYSGAGLVIAVASFVGLGLHAAVAFHDPNRHPARNRHRALALIDADKLEVVADPDEDLAEDPPPAGKTGVLIWLAVGAVGAVLGFVPVVLRAVKGWPVSADAKPEVVSPGDTVRVWFPGGFQAVEGYWYGRPRAVRVDGDHGDPLPATANEDHWGDTISGEDVGNRTTRVWADVTLPDAPAGAVVEVVVDMELEYPSAAGPRFNNLTANVTATRRYTLAEHGASSAYRTAFVVALVGAGVVTACGVGLWELKSRRHWLRK